MHSHYGLDFPHILGPDDLATMGQAYLLAMVELDGKDVDSQAVARTILRFYRKGLVDRHKLAALSSLAVLPRQSSSAVN